MTSILRGIRRLAAHVFHVMKDTPSYPNNHPTARISYDAVVTAPKFLFMGEDTSIARGATIMNSENGKFILKKWSFSSIDLLVVCGNHMPVIGMPLIKVSEEIKRQLDKQHQYEKDILVEEDVWIGARVTLLAGAHICRGAIIATGAVVIGEVPAYATFGGVPSRFIKFRWSIDEIIEHERNLYPEEERLSREELERMRKKYEQ